MTYKNLDELIEEYGNLKYMQSTASVFSSAKREFRKLEVKADKAKQAIIDYVEKEKRDTYDNGYEKAVELWRKADERRT